MDNPNEEIFQESPRLKAVWLTDAQKRAPIGATVLVVAYDLPEYVGQFGTVIGHDVGVNGEWPTMRVRLGNGKTDSFYCDGDDGIKDEARGGERSGEEIRVLTIP